MTTTVTTSFDEHEPTLDQQAATDIIDDLRSGIPPRRFVSLYSTGSEEFLDGVSRRHLRNTASRGKIRFVCGDWGSGKTHFLRLLREKAFDAGFLVSSVELSQQQATFGKFEEVFYEIVRNLTSPEMYQVGDLNQTLPFGEVLRRVVSPASDNSEEGVSYEVLQETTNRLMTDQSMDIDFRRIISNYWKTYLPEGVDEATLEDLRGKLLQWFQGEGMAKIYRSEFGVQKMVNQTNSRLMLNSLSRFALHAGYRGLLVLLDEAEESYASSSKPLLKKAFNNLLHLINGIDKSAGTVMIYAATPNFWLDQRYGILTYGALSGRIGEISESPPKPLDKVWNLNFLKNTTEDYQLAAIKIRNIYKIAEPESVDHMLSEEDLRSRLQKMLGLHPEYSQVHRWRLIITATVNLLDDSLDGDDPPSVENSYGNVIDKLMEG